MTDPPPQPARTIAHVSALRPMADSVNWQDIPVTMPMVAGYVPPSHFAWPPEAWARFPNSVKVRITPSAAVFGPGINVLDVEVGDASAAQVPGWINESRAAGQEPTVYMTISSWPSVIRACTSARVAVPEFWVAQWNNTQNLPSVSVDGVTYTAIAHQYADPTTSGGNYDLSVVAPFWPGVDGGDMPLDFTQQLPPAEQVRGSGTVGEAFTTVINGITNLRQGGNLANAVAELQANMGDVLTQLSAMSGSLSAADANLLTTINGVDADVRAGITQLASAIAANSSGQPTNITNLTTALAGPLSTTLAPLLPAGTTPAQFLTELAAHMTA